MATPKVAGKQPIQIDLEAGEHYWCACGQPVSVTSSVRFAVLGQVASASRSEAGNR